MLINPFPALADYSRHAWLYSDKLQKIALHAVLELCTRCKYLHMRIELLFHVVILIIIMPQYRRKKSDRLILAPKSSTTSASFFIFVKQIIYAYSKGKT